MKVIKTSMEGFLVIEPDVFNDERGFFLETFQSDRYRMAGITDSFVQDNQSRSTRGMLRGLHFLVKQPQAQLITILRGRVFDVGVDLRPESRTFGQWFGAELSDSGGARQIYMAPGFAHGFCVLSDFADLHYKTSLIYDPEDEGGLVYNDPEIGIEWPISAPTLSNRDLEYPCLRGLSLDQLPHV
ncbi:MAG: dTDP-4-dehydrorhamnose 3,5-epimerase [Candidatus Thioglobus sp.]|jgi:dTDP-4-dehydrorhamnose 3,5-epimerase